MIGPKPGISQWEYRFGNYGYFINVKSGEPSSPKVKEEKL